MKKYICFSCIAVFLAMFLCCSNGAISKNAEEKKKTMEEAIFLQWIPSQKEEAQEMEHFVPKNQEKTLPVTADGIISDFLLPQEEGESESAKAPTENRKFSISSKTKILIYHTHTQEAYRQDGADQYQDQGNYRTGNCEKNVVAVGEVLKENLEKYGFQVIHDQTNHEPPKLATSYSRSLKTMKAYQKKYPEIDVFIDLHRDAANVEKAKNDFIVVDGKRCARVMFVVGHGSNCNVPHDYDSNYALAQSISAALNEIHPKFTRAVREKKRCYNQHLSNMSMLVEIGHNANTLEEAKNAAVYLAQAMRKVIAIQR